MAIITILSGIPCSGKTTFRKKIMKVNPDLYCVSLDDLRLEYPNKSEDEISEIFFNRIKFLLNNNKDLILDNTFCKEKYINKIIEYYGNNKIQIKFFKNSLTKSYILNIYRWLITGKFIPFKIIKRMNINFKKINKHKYAKYMV